MITYWELVTTMIIYFDTYWELVPTMTIHYDTVLGTGYTTGGRWPYAVYILIQLKHVNVVYTFTVPL